MPEARSAGNELVLCAGMREATTASCAALRCRPTNVLVLLTLPALPAAIAPCLVRWLPIDWHWTVDLAACFPIQAGACLLVAAMVLFAARRRRLALLWAAGALAALAAVVPGWLAAGRAPVPAGAPLRVLCLNLLRGNEQDAGPVLTIVRGHAPDVVFCSEVTPEWLAALLPGLTGFPHRHCHADPGYFGLALFSKLPLASAEGIPLGYGWAPAVRAIVTTANGPIGLLGVHTPRPGLGDRCRERDLALAAIPQALAPLPPQRLVLGDCNATPWNRAFHELLTTTGLVDAGGDTFRPTWPVQLPWPLRVPIDHILLGGGIGAESIVTGPEFGSDHAPLFAVLRLAPK